MARPGPRDPGERDKRVTIEVLTDGAGATSGAAIETPTTLAQVFMSKEDQGARERFALGQTSAPFDTRWEMAYASNMDPELLDVPKSRRLVYQGRVYDIVGANLIGMREAIELLTLAGSRI